MPIVAWTCPVCKHDVALNHYATTDCGNTISEDYAAAVLHSERSHYRFGQRQIGVTDMLGCPRKAAITQTEDYAVDPLSLNSPLTGTAWHAYLKVANPVREVAVSGNIDGVPVVTQIDKVDWRRGRIEDDKHQNDYANRRLTTPKQEHVAQLVIGANLLRQTNGIQMNLGVIWAHFTGKPHLHPFHVELPTLESILDMKPLGGNITVRESLHWLNQWRAGDVTWKDLPLVGEDMSYGDKEACFYCPVFRVCKEEARGAAF